jgi:dinuclear metal center YbgI/SA1388 family protein
MATLDEIVSYLDLELGTGRIQDYPAALNGLQLANGGRVDRVVAAVDASLSVIEAAAQGGPGLLVVHHGMFWQGAQPITGATYRKLKTAMDAGLAIYSSHLPLDLHHEWGNNSQLAHAIGLLNSKPFCEQKGQAMGLCGDWEGTLEQLLDRLERVLGSRPHCCAAGPTEISSLGIITGGAGAEVARVAACGIQTFITGEGPHWSYTLAEELGVNLIYGGHYLTETFGVKALASMLSNQFELPWCFIDMPTGL